MYFTNCTFIRKRSIQDTLIYFISTAKTSTVWVLVIQTFTPTHFKHDRTYIYNIHLQHISTTYIG